MGTSFWTSIIPRWINTSDRDLPLRARVATLEGDVLEMRTLAERQYTQLRKLSGKVYRGVALGDTTEAVREPPEADEAPVEQVVLSPNKAELYQRAAQLRRH